MPAQEDLDAILASAARRRVRHRPTDRVEIEVTDPAELTTIEEAVDRLREHVERTGDADKIARTRVALREP